MKGYNRGLPDHLVYVGFWLRFIASVIDSFLVLLIVLPLVQVIYGGDQSQSDLLSDPRQILLKDPLGFLIKGPLDFLISWIFPALAVITFWIYRSATPGKMFIGAKILDSTTLEIPTKRQLIGRYFGYYLSMLPLIPPLGMLWIAFDRRKQGWHDKLAGTVVVREKSK